MSTQAQKEEAFQKYDWSANAQWQSYLQNVYPMPPMARLMKMKRRWYKNNVDKDFNAEMPDASAASQSSANTTTGADRGQRNPGGPPGAQRQYNQYNPFFAGLQPRPDVKPEFKGAQFLAWLFYFLSFAGFASPTLAAFVALAIGIIRKGGFPKMNMDYAQSILLDENTQMLGMLAIASSASALTIICWAPVVIHGLLVCAWTSNDVTHVHGFYLKLIELVKKTGLLKRVSDN